MTKALNFLRVTAFLNSARFYVFLLALCVIGPIGAVITWHEETFLLHATLGLIAMLMYRAFASDTRRQWIREGGWFVIALIGFFPPIIMAYQEWLWTLWLALGLGIAIQILHAIATGYAVTQLGQQAKEMSESIAATREKVLAKIGVTDQEFSSYMEEVDAAKAAADKEAAEKEEATEPQDDDATKK